MKDQLKPYKNELPSQFSERLGIKYSILVSKMQKKELGQFFTSAILAKFMSSKADIIIQDNIKILDPGCGVLTLSCALIESIVDNNIKVKRIELDAFDLDSSLTNSINLVSQYLNSWCKKKKIDLIINYKNSDFILFNEHLIKKGSGSQIYDFIISNPPYFKVRKNDPRLRVFNYVLQGQQNIYGLFLLASSKLLSINGQLIFVIPRSFTSGLYFQSFRELFLKNVIIEEFHIFNSRKEGFKRDQVLQENIILKASRKKSNNSQNLITITSSFGVMDLDKLVEREYYSGQLIKKIGDLTVIHLPVNFKQEEAMQLFATWTNNLNAIGMKVSTGPVVPFRSKKYIKHRKSHSQNCVPLLWMHNCKKMVLEWPLNKAEKESWILDNSQSNCKTIVNQNYIFLRRFSSKDDESKLIASPHIKENLQFEKIGVENHLNYLHKIHGNMDVKELFGLSVLYNSSLFDSYFRALTGNTQISATELNSTPLPSIEIIRTIGEQYLSLNGKGLNEIDNIVNSVFGLPKNLKNE